MKAGNESQIKRPHFVNVKLPLEIIKLSNALPEVQLRKSWFCTRKKGQLSYLDSSVFRVIILLSNPRKSHAGKK